jgi:DNA polymerase elongation subunit (family B)
MLYTTDTTTPDLLVIDLETTGLCGTAPDAGITDIALGGSWGTHVITGTDERNMLRQLSDTLTLFTGIVVTWWGTGFDWPYLADRYAAHGMPTPFVITSAREGRPSDHHPNPVILTVASVDGRWQHVDACNAWRPIRKAAGLSSGLKAVAADYGMNPVVVDRERMADLTDDERITYAASDAAVTYALAVGLGDLLAVHIDRP